MLQNKLLKVLEDKRVYFDSAYYDPTDPQVPKYIRKLLKKGPRRISSSSARRPGILRRSTPPYAPAARKSFLTLGPGRDRADRRPSRRALGGDLGPGVPKLISEYTVEGRKATSLLADAYGLALYELDPTLLEQFKNQADGEESKTPPPSTSPGSTRAK